MYKKISPKEIKKQLRTYEIPISSINEGEKKIYYKLDHQFFSLFPESLIQQANINVTISIRSGTTLQVTVDLQGTIVLTCDRSLMEFESLIKTTQFLIFKWGKKEETIDENIFIISDQTTVLNLALHLYDFIHLQIPIKKLHPELKVEKDQIL